MKTTLLTKTILIAILCQLSLLFSTSIKSQNVGINSTGALPNSSSMLDVDATDKGILIPRMTTIQRNAIVSPAVSLMIFNTTTNCLEIYVNSTWQSIYCGCSGPPAVPGTVSGNITICSGSSNTYFIAPVVGATSYTWTAPVGWTINSGQGTISIGTTSSAISGDVCVSSVNACGTSSQSCLTVTVNTIPATPGVITGLTSVTNGQVGVVYSIAAVPGATTYTWSVPAGSTITSGQGTTSITVTFGATSGDVCVTAGNTCGTSASSCLAVTVNNCSNIWTQSFTNGDGNTTTQCNSWNAFVSSLTNCYTQLTITGTFDGVGISCTDPTIVGNIVNALQTNTYYEANWAGRLWKINCNGGLEKIWADPAICSGSDCPSPSYIIRPCIMNPNWGGVNTATCGGPTQTMTVWFH